MIAQFDNFLYEKLDFIRFRMRLNTLLNKMSIVVLLIAIFNSVLFTSVTQVVPVMNDNSLPLSSKVKMTIVDELNEGGGAKDVQIVGDIAYVLSDYGLNIYNVANPKRGLELGHYYSDGYLGHSIALYNDYVFAAADDKGLIIINVTEPSNPIYANTYFNTRPAAIYIQNNLLFVANWGNDFEIYDITNVPLITELIRFEGDGYSYAYANNDLSFGFANNGSLLILDIKNPEKIEKIGQIDDEEISCITIDENFWYTGGSNGVKVFNSTKLSEPVLVNHFAEIEASMITNLAILDGFLYVSDYHLGFRIFNISDSINLTEIGRNEVGGSPLGFQVEGEIAYVASQNRGVQIIKIQINGNESMSFGTEFILLSIIILGLFSKRINHRRKNQ
jgi:hypothetical protein